MSYHVFIERPQDGADTAKVASAIAARYKLPEQAIAKRLATGRFRVKANVDLDTAKAFARDLERLGAVCTIADASSGKAATATPQPSPVGTPPPAAVGRPPAIPSGPIRPRSAEAAAKAATVAAQSAAPPPAAASAPADYQSGLAAAFSPSGEQDSPELGAIDTGEFKLSSLDGEEGVPASYADEAHFTPPPGGDAFAPPDADDEELAIDTGPPESSSGSAPLPPAAANAFAPPDSEEEELVLVDTPPPRKTPLPMPAAASVSPEEIAALDAGEGALELTPSQGVTRVKPGLADRFREEFIDRPRVRFAAGIVLCVLLAWIPARIYWGTRVDNAQAELDLAMQEPTSVAKTDESAWLELEAIGRAQMALVESRLVNTKISAVMIWLAVGGLLGFVYFRKIPWDDL